MAKRRKKILLYILKGAYLEIQIKTQSEKYLNSISMLEFEYIQYVTFVAMRVDTVPIYWKRK